MAEDTNKVPDPMFMFEPFDSRKLAPSPPRVFETKAAILKECESLRQLWAKDRGDAALARIWLRPPIIELWNSIWLIGGVVPEETTIQDTNDGLREIDQIVSWCTLTSGKKGYSELVAARDHEIRELCEQHPEKSDQKIAEMANKSDQIKALEMRKVTKNMVREARTGRKKRGKSR